MRPTALPTSLATDRTLDLLPVPAQLEAPATIVGPHQRAHEHDDQQNDRGEGEGQPNEHAEDLHPVIMADGFAAWARSQQSCLRGGW